MSDEVIPEHQKSLEQFLNLFVDWFFAAIHPIETCRSILSITDEREKNRATLKLVVPAFLVSVVLDLALYQPYGPGLSSKEFYLSCFACLTFALIACGFAIRLSLKLYGVKAALADIMAIYATFVISYLPLVTILSYPSYLRLFSGLSSAKRQGFDVGQTVALLLNQGETIAKSNNFIGMSSGLSSCFLLAITCICSAFMASTVAERFSVSRVKSFSAFAFATMFSLPPILVLQGFISAFIVFRFM
jgi:hypothetical protein